jgi:hypothetical protein
MNVTLDSVTRKHANFIVYARETLAQMGVKEGPTVTEFLGKTPVEMLSVLKILLKAMPRSGVEGIVLSKLGVQREDVPVERLEKLLRYSEYFCEVAKSL